MILMHYNEVHFYSKLLHSDPGVAERREGDEASLKSTQCQMVFFKKIKIL